MFYITGRIADKVILEKTDITGADMYKYSAAIAVNYGGAPADYSILVLDSNDVRVERIRAGDEWTGVWTGNVLSDVSFTSYDAKYLLEISSDKAEILADGVNKCRVSIRVIDSNLEPVNASETGYYLAIGSPLVPVHKKFDIINGVAEFDFSTVTPGTWKFPLPGVKTTGAYRIKNYLTIEALMV